MDLFAIRRDEIDAAIADRGIDRITDAALVTGVSHVLARPRTAHTSFTLHAPLELMARARLLPLVRPEARAGARARLVALAAGYDHSGEAVDSPAGEQPATVEAATEVLWSAVAHHDADAADRAALALSRLASPADLAERLGDGVVPLLGAAGHAPIALTQWPRVTTAPLDGAIVRHLLRDLAAEGALQFRFDQPNATRPPGSAGELADALAAVEPVGDPGFGVFLIMDQAERHRALAALPGVDPGDVPGAFRLVLRRAAHAMITDDPAFAPYGWSHALTMPLALAQLAPHLTDPTVALDAAITEWCGFRMAHGRGPVVDAEPAAATAAPASALTASPAVAAATAWHRPDEMVPVLVDNAATSHDAHLVKYTVAALDAARLDASARRLYLAAAAFLAGWWRQHPPADDPLPAAAVPSG